MTEVTVTPCLNCGEPFDRAQLIYRRADNKGWYTTCLACGQVQPAPQLIADPESPSGS